MISTKKPKVAFFDFAGCEGCQLTVIDTLQSHPELLEAVEIVQFREAMSERDEDFEIAFVEGSYSRPSDKQRLNQIREQAKFVIALGACAHIGGVNALRNAKPMQEVRRTVYDHRADHYEAGKALPIAAAIPVDAFIPGCPIDRHEFIRAVKTLLQGFLPEIPDYPLCVECKLRENDCLYNRNEPCLGPIIRAGCSALCTTFGVGCEGCRGLIPNPNIESLKEVMAEHGLSQSMIEAKLSLFMTNELKDFEVVYHGS
ncbi:MAG: NADH:ubiquinone oxidoreductase [Chloroflexi bacterium RBG_16_48_8]|nr:MAG: NADH:ubiquinone oxidoreductase [Chloroflexi bacterium RBG_16_48_8]